METYKLDDTLKHVKLKVLVGSTGSARTRVYLNYTTRRNFLFESDDSSNGDIPATKAGTNRELVLETLIVMTVLNFSNIPPMQRDKAIKKAHIMYVLNGGPDGEQIYGKSEDEVDDTNIRRVIITKKIEFV